MALPESHVSALPVRTRSMLFAPGSNERILSKVFDAGSDAVALDLEDAVPTSRKGDARALVAAAIDAQLDRARGPRVVVRVNSPDTGLTIDDLEMAVRPGVWAIQFTKIGSAEALAAWASRIDELELRRGLPKGAIRVLSSVDSAHLSLNLAALVRATPRLYCVIAGGVDFAVDLGTRLSDDMIESLWTRSYAVLTSRDACIAGPLHPPALDLADDEGLARVLRQGKALGFQGAVALHPKQLPIIHSIFGPTAEELRRAREVVAAFEAAEAQGVASVQVDGQFIDYAVVKQAIDTLAMERPEETDEPGGHTPAG
jgi:citrate lyase subunit beta / citryl-CoA lyase